MSTFQERINQFRGGLDAQQSHFNDAMGDAMEYGKHYVADKLGQHYENIEKIGGATLSGALTAGAAINKFKEIRNNLQNARQTRGMKTIDAGPVGKAPSAPKTQEFTNRAFDPTAADDEPRTETKAPRATNQDEEAPSGESGTEKALDFTGERLADAAEKRTTDPDEAAPRAAPAAGRSDADMLSDLQTLKTPTGIPGRTGIPGVKFPQTEEASTKTAPVETAEPSFEDQMASIRGGLGDLRSQISKGLSPADTEALNQQTAQRLQSLGGRTLGGAGTNNPELLQDSDLGQRTAGLGSRGFTPRQRPAADDPGTLQDIQGVSDLEQRTAGLGRSFIQASPSVNPARPAAAGPQKGPVGDRPSAPATQEFQNPAFSAGGKGNAVEAPRTGAGKPPEAQASAAVQDAQDATTAAAKGTTSAIAQAGEFKSAAVSAAGGAAEIAAGAVGGVLGGKSGIKGDVGDAAQGGLALKQAASAGQTIAQKAGFIKSSAQPAQGAADLADKAPSYLDQATAYAKGQVSDAMDAAGGAIRNVASKVMTDAAIDGVSEVAGAAMTAIPIIGDLAGAGMLIYGLVKDIKEQKKNPNPQQVETSGVGPTEQAGGIDTRAIGGSQQTGSGIV